MSTKTTIKRVALVAAVALTLGGFSAVSASAASGTTITQVTGTGDAGVGGVAGPANSLQVVVTPDSTLSNVKGYVTVTGGTITSSGRGATVAANGLSVIVNAAYDTLTINTPTAGTLVINVYDAVSATNFSSTVSVTKSITVSATAIAGTYDVAKSSVYIVAGETNTVATADAAAITVLSTAAGATDTASTAAATIQVTYRDANGSNITTDSITATISSGPGTINGQGDSGTITSLANSANTYSKSVTSTNGAAQFVIWPNGQTGVTTVTVKNKAGTVLATKTLTFAGTTPASIKVKNLKSYVSYSASAVDAFAYNVYDASGNEIKALSTAPTAAVATGVTAAGSVLCGTTYDSTNGYFTCAVTASAATTAAKKDVTDAYTFTAVTGVTTTASVTYVDPVAASLSISAAPTADAGSKITYTITIKNAAGNPIPDAAYAPGTFIASVSPSASLVANPFGATSADTITTVAGVATTTAYAPFGGTLTIDWKLSGTAGTANAALAKTLTGTTVSASTTINGGSDSALAVDAANAATDAANAAAEEASNATEAASEALAAVNALATTVASLIAGIKKQLVALTALVMKLKK